MGVLRDSPSGFWAAESQGQKTQRAEEIGRRRNGFEKLEHLTAFPFASHKKK